MFEPFQHRPVFLAMLIATLGLMATCGTADAAGPFPGFDVIYGLGLGSCTEMCRPFGVLSFGVATLGDGNVVCECECMPGPALDVKEDDKKNEAQEEDSPEENSAQEESREPVRFVRPPVIRDHEPGTLFGIASSLLITRP